MPTVTYDHAALAALQARVGLEHDRAALRDGVGDIGCTVEHEDATALTIEFEPNRPDLLGVETFQWAMRRFLGGADADPRLPTMPGDVRLRVDPSLADVRPVILAAVVRGVPLGEDDETRDAFVKSLMDLQEKLHHGLGRRRRRASIGVHDLAALEPPFRVETVPADFAFVPLAREEPMSIADILQRHPKGVDYARLLDGFTRFPVILDASDAVLSFPPIINGAHTTVTTETTDFFIDVTGWDEVACHASLLLVSLAMAERGGTIETVEVTDLAGTVRHTPAGEARRLNVPLRLLHGLLGQTFTEAEVREALRRMGCDLVGQVTDTDAATSFASVTSDDDLEAAWAVDVPPWRSDLLHPVDLVEEVAIGHGYATLGTDVARVPSVGRARGDEHLLRRLREAMIGLGSQEVVSLTLSNDASQFERLRLEPLGEVTRVTNAITKDHTMLRQRILPQLLELLALNRHHELPQRVWELGRVTTDHAESWRLGWLAAEIDLGFAGVRGQVQAVLADLGASAERLTFVATAVEDGPWLAGRGAAVLIDGEEVGRFGEIDPAVSGHFELLVPLAGAELDVAALDRLLDDPVH